MLNVVFTGPAVDGTGHAVVRADLIAACKMKGNLSIQPSIRIDTDALVASRTDTVKAKVAANRGIAVFTYPEFIAKFLRGVTIATGGKPVKYVDGVDKDLLVPDFTAGQALEALDVL